ncbi:hypothetical protein INT45_001748 [Circinella minor]|uniref:Uncharacterized protein n=1 Tax=Circinella minor TaxID=1195481 RepID=A0A8H7S5Y2_9FUNG|nr:hypothetical protein INT45_001748 [Circinella minor]
MSVNVSWEISMNHDVHVDFEKPSFAYHYHDKFPIRNVTEYNRLVCAVFDPTVQKPPISVPRLGTMNDVFEVPVDQAQNTSNHERRVEHMEAKPLRSNLRDEIEHDKRGVSKSTHNVFTSSSFKLPEPTTTVYHDSNEASVDTSTTASCGTAALQKIRDVSWRDRADDLKVVRYDAHSTTEVPSLSTVVTSRGASFIEGGFSGIDLSYRVLNRYVLEALSHSMVLSENMCIPFMTLYGDAPGYRDIYSVKRCPSLDGRRLREMFMSSLDTFRCYSPLLSTSATENYWTADGKQESRVKASIEDPLRFYSGPMDASLKAFDDFVKVWNTLSQKMTVASVVIESNNDNREGKFYFPFNRKRRTYEQACKTFEYCSAELALMSEFYAKFLRPKNLIMVPVKSVSTASRISRLSSWLDMIKQPLFPVCLSDEGVWKFDKMCDAYFGVNIFRISKTLRNGEVVRGFGFMSTYLFVPRHIVHALIDDHSAFGSVSLHDLPGFEAENIEGVRFNFRVVHEDVRGDMYICVPDRVPYDDYKGATSRECSRVESVKIVSVMTDSSDHFVKVFSTRGTAVYDGLSGRGIVSDCEVDLGMSGSLVVSCDGLEPLGLVQAVTEDRKNPTKKSLVFTSFGSKVEVFTRRRPGFLGWNRRFDVTFGADAELGTKPASDATIQQVGHVAKWIRRRTLTPV